MLFREDEGESVIFLPEYGYLKKLNRMGTIIWKLIDGKRTDNDIVKEICDHLRDKTISEEKVQEDVFSFLKKLKEGGFITYE